MSKGVFVLLNLCERIQPETENRRRGLLSLKHTGAFKRHSCQIRQLCSRSRSDNILSLFSSLKSAEREFLVECVLTFSIMFH